MKVLSFFTGGGFLDIGFIEAGFEIAWANEFDLNISDIHDYGMSKLYPEMKDKLNIAFRGSITDVDISVLKEDFRNQEFGIIGGPPCPDFSVGGKNKGREGERGQLSSSYVNTIIDLKPKFFLFENVKGLVSTKKHREYLHELIVRLEQGGYLVDYSLLNSLDYDAPQARERVIMIGLLKESFNGLPEIGSKGWFPYDKYKRKVEFDSWPTTNPFGGTPRKPKGLPESYTVGYTFNRNPNIETLPNQNEFFTPKSSKFLEVLEGDDSRKSFKRLHRHRYSPTACYGNNEVHLHPWKARRISVREALRIQTVPDQYEMPKEKSLSIKFKVVGNGVPCTLAESVAKTIKEFMDAHSK